MDAAGVDRSSIALESALTSGAYNLVLQGLVHRSPALPIIHVPVDRTFAWSQGSEDALVAIVSDWWWEVNQPDAQFVMFHFTDDAHCCALLLDVLAWKAGPITTSAAESAAVAAAASSAVSSLSALHPPSDRRISRSTRAAAAVSPPLLHIDTLPSACSFAEDAHRMLVALGGALDSLFSTSWCITPQSVKRTVRAARMSLQEDDWACGYHLLHRWSLLFASFSQADSATSAASMFDHVDAACSRPLLPVDELISFVSAEYDKSRAAQLEVRGICCMPALYANKQLSLLTFFLSCCSLHAAHYHVACIRASSGVYSSDLLAEVR